MPDQPATATVAGRPVPVEPDLGRMRAERVGRLDAEMERSGLDGVVLLGPANVSYATGALAPGHDPSRALIARPVAMLARGSARAHVFTPFPEAVPEGYPADHVHEAVFPDLSDGAGPFAGSVAEIFPPGARLGFDELTHPLRAALGRWDVTDGCAPVSAARVVKTVDELACIGKAQAVNEQAMKEVAPLLRPGVRQHQMTAAFAGAVHRLGATSNAVDPVWQPVPPSLSLGPWTTHGGVAFPTPSSDRFLREGDVVWVDTGIGYRGYVSDFGRTWIVSEHPRPNDRQDGQFQRWMEVVNATLDRCKPGATGLDLTRAAIEANGGSRPWIDHLYLAHGVGTDSAEMPLIGTDRGDRFDETVVLVPGMVLVLEPVIWDDGAGGYRSEDVYVITDDGWAALGDFPYDPFGDRR